MKKALLRTKIIGVVVLVAVVVLSWLFLLNPMFSKPGQIAERTTAAQTTKASTEAQIKKAKEQVSSLPQVNAEVAQINAKFPSDIDPSLLQSRVLEMAAQAGLPASAVTGVKPGDITAYVDPATKAESLKSGAASAAPSAAASAPPPGGDTILQQQVTVNITGSLAQIGAFSDIIVNETNAFAIESINISGGSTGTYNATITGYVYLLPPMKPAPDQATLDELSKTSK